MRSQDKIFLLGVTTYVCGLSGIFWYDQPLSVLGYVILIGFGAACMGSVIGYMWNYAKE